MLPEYDFSEGEDELLSFRMLELERPTEYDSRSPHRHKYNEIFIFTHGGGTHMIDFKEIRIEDHSIHFVFPGQVHRLSREQNSEGFVILFPPSFLHAQGHSHESASPLESFWSHPILRPSETEFHKWLKTVKDMQAEIDEPTTGSVSIVGNLLNIFLIRCAGLLRKTNSIPAEIHEILAYRFRSLVEKNFFQLHQVHEYAEIMNVTADHLSEGVKKAFGHPAGEFIQKRITLEARRLLHHSHLSTKEIAHLLGFDDPAYFNRYFKKAAGQAPGEFRKTIREKYKLGEE